MVEHNEVSRKELPDGTIEIQYDDGQVVVDWTQRERRRAQLLLVDAEVAYRGSVAKASGLFLIASKLAEAGSPDAGQYARSGLDALRQAEADNSRVEMLRRQAQ